MSERIELTAKEQKESRKLWPTCSQCNCPVERMESRKDRLRQVTVFTAYCHGEREETVLSDMDKVGAESIVGGQAFVRLSMAFAGMDNSG